MYVIGYLNVVLYSTFILVCHMIMVEQYFMRSLNMNILVLDCGQELLFTQVISLCLSGTSGEYLEMLSSKSDTDLISIVYRKVGISSQVLGTGACLRGHLYIKASSKWPK